MTDRMQVVTRFAPSPTGFMHIGGVRTALFAYLWAHKNNGTFILRIEDTDREREVPGSIEHIQESLRWLGLDWDYGPDKAGPFGSCIQSERLETYLEAARGLVEKGLAYPDPYTAEEIEAWRARAQAEKRPFLFRDHRPETFMPWDGKAPLRFKVPEIKRYRWTDAVRGELEAGAEALDDFILIKGDGYPTYNFAHIIDDRAMGVTHVMRGDEFISSTPRFLSLYDALGIEYPVFVTLPPILRDDKTKKLGKRDGAKDMLEYRSEGYLADAMINFLALIGWNPGTEKEVFSKEELMEAFELSRIQSHGAVFNEDKLRWLNREHLLERGPDALFEYIAPALKLAVGDGVSMLDDATVHALIPVIQERINVSSDITTMKAEGELDFYFTDPMIDTAKLPNKDESVEDTRKHLLHVRERISELADDAARDPEKIKSVLWDYATESGRGNVLWPLRFALTGREKSPDPFTVASIIGKGAVMRRIDSALIALNPI